MCNVSMVLWLWLRFQGGVPLRVWDRLGVTAQVDTLLIRTPVCIGLNLNHAKPPLPTHQRSGVGEPQTWLF